MKLKYLLPIATIASVTSVVTPLVTSCSNGPSAYEWDFSKRYASKFSRHEPGSMDVPQATKAYLEDVKQNKVLWTDDCFVSNDQWAQAFPVIGYTFSKYVATCQLDKVDVNNQLVSYHISMELVAQSSSNGQTFNMKYNLNLENLKVYVSNQQYMDINEGLDFEWYLLPFWYFDHPSNEGGILEELKANHDWRISGTSNLLGWENVDLNWKNVTEEDAEILEDTGSVDSPGTFSFGVNHMEDVHFQE